MWIFEYDEEKHMRMEREEHFEAGFEAGQEAGFEAGQEVGHKAGFEAGQEQIFWLMEQMRQDGLMDSIPRLATDSDFLNEMLRKYGL